MIPIAHLHLADVMDRHVVSVTPQSTIASMVSRMRAEHVSHIVVLDNAKPIGMLTERDLVKLLHQKIDRSLSVQEFMSTPVSVVPGALGFRSAYIQLCLSRLRHLVVVDNNGAVIGVAAERDFLGHLGMELFQNVRSLRDLIDRTVPQLPPAIPVTEAVDLMVQEKRGCIVVAGNGRLLGIFTENQVPTVLARHEDGSAVALGEVMRRSVNPVTERVSIAEVMAQMVSDRIGYVVVVDEDGGIIGTIAQSRLLENVRTAVFAEIATRQLVEDQLRQVEAQLEATLEHTPNVAVQWYDIDGRVHYWNHASEALYGWTAVEAAGRTLDELFMTLQDAYEFKNLLAEVGCSGKTFGPMEYRTRNRKKESRWVETTIFPIPGEGEGDSYFVRMDLDISKRKQAEETLRASEERLRFALGTAHLSWFEANLLTGQINVGPEYPYILGFNPNEFQPNLKNWLDNIHPDDAASVNHGYQEMLVSGGPTAVEYRRRTASGDWKWFLSTGAVVDRDEAGRPVRVSGVQMDIGDRKQAEESLRKASQYSRNLIEASLDPLVTISPEGKITDVNHATEVITGRSRVELIGSDFSTYFTRPDEARAGYQQVFSEGKVIDYPLAIRHASGKITDVLYNATIYRSDTGEVEGVFAAARDITALKRAEADIRSASHLLNSIVDNIPNMIFLKRADDLRFVIFNKAGEQLLGFDRSDLLGKNDYDG